MLANKLITVSGFFVQHNLLNIELLLGRVALGAQWPIVIQIFRGLAVGLCVGLFSPLWKNGGSDQDAV